MRTPHEVATAIMEALPGLSEWWGESEQDGQQVVFLSAEEIGTVKLTIQPVEGAALDYAPEAEQRKHLEEPHLPRRVA